MKDLALVASTFEEADEGNRHLIGVTTVLDAEWMKVKTLLNNAVSVGPSETSRYFRKGTQTRIADVA